jgi:hypothetical protein
MSPIRLTRCPAGVLQQEPQSWADTALIVNGQADGVHEGFQELRAVISRPWTMAAAQRPRVGNPRSQRRRK